MLTILQINEVVDAVRAASQRARRDPVVNKFHRALESGISFPSIRAVLQEQDKLYMYLCAKYSAQTFIPNPTITELQKIYGENNES